MAHHYSNLHLHELETVRYKSRSDRACDLCGCRLAVFSGPRCLTCKLDVHRECAGYFSETIQSFFAHPSHALRLARRNASSASAPCELCKVSCPPASWVYCCTRCAFVVHPLCTLLPRSIRIAHGEEHDELYLVPSWGRCTACRQDLHVWHYRCPCLIRQHIACAATNQQQQWGCGGGGGGDREDNRVTRVADVLHRRPFRAAVECATDGLATPVLNLLSTSSSSQVVRR